MNTKKPSSMTKGYLNTADLCARYRCSSRTIFRWMGRDQNPFPQPKMRPSGSHNLWAIEDVEAWEEAKAGKKAA